MRYHVSGQYCLRLVTHILRTERGDAAVVQVRGGAGGGKGARVPRAAAAQCKSFSRRRTLIADCLCCLPARPPACPLQPYEPGETTRIALLDRLSGTNSLEKSAGGEEGQQEMAALFELYSKHGDSLPPSLPAQVRERSLRLLLQQQRPTIIPPHALAIPCPLPRFLNTQPAVRAMT